MHSVDVIRIPGTKEEPRIIVQRRPEEETFAMTVQEAEQYLEDNMMDKCHGNADTCLWCAIHDALSPLR